MLGGKELWKEITKKSKAAPSILMSLVFVRYLFIYIFSVLLYLLFLPLCSLPIQQKRSWYCSLTFARLPRTRGKRRLGGVEPRYYQQEAANLFFQRAEEISILEVMRSSCFSTFLEWFVGSFVKILNFIGLFSLVARLIFFLGGRIYIKTRTFDLEVVQICKNVHFLRGKV